LLQTALAFRLLLAAALAVAGVAKLADRVGGRKALRDFGFPEGAARLGSTLVPLLEITIAVGLVVSGTAWWSAVAAFALLAVFSAVILANLVRGNTPDCHCFGRIHSAPIGRGTLVRNMLLAACAAGIVASRLSGSQLNPVGWLGRLSGVELGLTVAVATVAVALVGWMAFDLSEARGNGDSGAHLPVGEPVPDFDLATAEGGRAGLHALLNRGHPLMLIFTQSRCGPCNALLPEVAQWQQAYGARLTIAVVAARAAGEDDVHPDAPRLKDILIQDGHEVANAYGVRGTPSGVLISRSGEVQTPIAAGAEALRELLSEAVGRPVVRGSKGVPAREPGTLITRRAVVLRGLFAAATFTGVGNLYSAEPAGASMQRCPFGLWVGACLDSVNAAYKRDFQSCLNSFLTLPAGERFIKERECVAAERALANRRRALCKNNCPPRPPKLVALPPNPHPLPPPPAPPKGPGGPCDTCTEFCLPCGVVTGGYLCCAVNATPTDPNPCCPKA
jgi:thiol-disulfide isomerase/thioredoxin